MKTKEAIEFLELYRKLYYDTSYYTDMDEVIVLLKRGKKYRLMWFELYGIASEFNFFPMMDKIEQKYLREAEK